MKNIALCCFGFVSISLLPVSFANADNGFDVNYHRTSPSAIMVEANDYRPGMVTCNVSTPNGVSLGQDSWHHSPPSSRMIINVNPNIFAPSPEVNCNITYDN